MNRTLSYTLLGIAVAVVAVVGLYLVSNSAKEEGTRAPLITSYEECAAAGYPIMESHPEQCMTPDGQNFTRELREDELLERSVVLYYYNPLQDTDETGNVRCTSRGLVPLERTIPITETPIQDTIRLLIQGNLTPDERAEGIDTEYPLSGFELEGVSIDGETLTLSFADPEFSTTGGSCRAAILWMQIRETALQFDEVSEVQFQPEELFQP